MEAFNTFLGSIVTMSRQTIKIYLHYLNFWIIVVSFNKSVYAFIRFNYLLSTRSTKEYAIKSMN